MSVDGGSSSQVFDELEVDRKPAADGIEDASSRRRDFGADAITGQDDDARLSHRLSRPPAGAG